MSLQPYLRKAYSQVRLGAEPLLKSVEGLDGTLKRDSDNLILVYGGSFNPPHRGHIDVLLSALRREVSPVAIVVLPSENFHLRNKLADSHPEFFLSRQRRADLWNALPSVPKDKVWIWPSTWYPFLPFTEAVCSLAKEDGFRVAFSHLIGPDNLNPGDPLMNLPYRLPRMLVTTRARRMSAHFTDDGPPRTWTGFGSWSRGEEYDNGMFSIHNDVRVITFDVDPGSLTADMTESHHCCSDPAVLWKCKGTDDPSHIGYYLEYAKSYPTDVNSTALRRDLLVQQNLDEEKLNNMSIEDLVTLITPFL